MSRAFIALFLILSTLAFAIDKLTVKQLQADTKKYDNKEIILTGKVDQFKQRTSRAGNPYFTFKMVDKADKKIEVNVYGQGKPDKEPKNGDMVEVKGIYRVEKQFAGNTFKNEIQIKPQALDIIEPPK
jgi:DNA polymerase III alpha subunit